MTALSDREVMLRFESFGDTCEFGFAQRAVGAEPLSLLRWGGAPLPGLVSALRARFAGLYRREDLLMVTDDLVMDGKYDLRFHCGAYLPAGVRGPTPLPRTAAAAAMHAREARHVAFQLRTTLENLAERSKIIVYKVNAGMRPVEMLQLKSALDLYGPQRLLCVLPAHAGLAAGEVKLFATGVKVAGMARFAPYTVQQETDVAGWLAVCRGALAGVWGDEAVAPAEVRGAVEAGEMTAVAGMVDGGAAGFALTELGVEISNAALGRGVLNALYRTLLLRAPDEGGMRAHLGAMLGGQKAMEDVIESMLRSGEFAAGVEAFLARYSGRPG